jgi:Uncharacterized protein conserved in bacteria (DUF2130)
MEAATPLHSPQPHVRVTGDRIRIDGLVVVDETAARLLSEAASPDRVIEDAIEIGARVLDREQTGANAEFVKTEFEKVSKTVENEFGERAKGVAEELSRKVDEVFDPEAGHLSKSLEQLFSDGSSTAVQHKVRQIVTEAMQKSREDLRRQFSSADGADNPLAEFKQATVRELRRTSDEQQTSQRRLLERMGELEKQLQGLRDEKQKLEEVAEERERGTAKGRSYEESVAEAIERIAGVQDDVCEAVGDEAGAGGRKGDVVVTVGGATGPGCGRVVFEVKNKRLTKPEFQQELDAARSQRDAEYAVLIVPSEDKIPAKLHALREYYGDKIIAVYDPEDGSTLELEFAYRVARARVSISDDAGDEVDAAAVAAGVGRARDAMNDVRKIKSQLTGAQSSIGAARELVDSLAAQVRGRLDEIDELLIPADGAQQLAVD